MLTLQQMVNQMKGERDSLSQELRRSRAVKARLWCGEGPPDHHQDLEERMKSSTCELRDALEFGSPEVVACVSTLLAQGASRKASMPRDTDVCLDRRRRCQAQGAFLRGRRCQAKYGLRGVRVRPVTPRGHSIGHVRGESQSSIHSACQSTRPHTCSSDGRAIGFFLVRDTTVEFDV